MKIAAICALTSVVLGSPCAVAEQSSPDIFQIQTAITFAENNAGAEGLIATAPSDKRMVIQTVSYVRTNAAAASVFEGYIATTIFGIPGFFALPTSTSPNQVTPSGATLSATIYDGAGGDVILSCVRSGDVQSPETVYVTIAGYYVAKP